MVEGQLDHFKDWIGTRIVLKGATTKLTPAAAQGIGMALHELATNAAKYGAFSNSEGRVQISWRVDDAEQPTFSMSWLEEGGPPVGAPSHSGFGQMVMGRMAQATVGGTVEMDYREGGLCWTLTAPARTTLDPGGIVRRSRTY